MRNLLSWLPWLAVVVVVGVVGGVLGVTGAIGRPIVTRSVIGSNVSVPGGAPAYSCPGGALVTNLAAHDRVLAIERSDDSSFVGVRDPLNVAREVWVSAEVVSVDPDQSAIATLPVGSCPAATGILMPPTNRTGTTPTKPSNPTTPTKPSAPDTTPPTLGTPTANRGTASDPVCVNAPLDPTRQYAIISVSASDNRGVTAVSISWSGPGGASGSGSMTRSGSVWKFTYDPASTATTGTASFTLQARDAVGNKSAVRKIDLVQEGCVD
jgi:hypothetical protein